MRAPGTGWCRICAPMIALSLLAFLLIAGILAFSLLQWEGAQRRELLYFHLTLEKPGSNYFRSARLDREQYGRVALAAAVLSLHQLAVVGDALCGEPWMARFGAAGTPPWVLVFGQALLAYALLFQPLAKRPRVMAALIAVSVIACLGTLVAAIGGLSAATSWAWARVIEGALGLGVAAVVGGLPQEERIVQPKAFLLWSVGALSPWAWIHHLALTLFYAVFGFRVFCRVVEHHEALEGNLHRMQRQREVIVGFLDRIGAAYSDALDLEQLLRLLASAAVETTGAGAGAIFLVDSRTGKLQMRAVEGPFPPLYRDVPASNLMRRWEELTRIALRQRFAFGQGVVGEVAAKQTPLRIRDAAEAGILVGSVVDPVRRHPMLLTPLVLRGEVLGVMAVLNRQNADEFSEDDQFLLATLAEQAAFYIDNARMVAVLAQQERVRRELQIAREIQRTLLPADAPKVPGFDLDALSRPALEMGGDYYDFFWVAEGHLGIVVADVSGKGVPAALTMAMLRTVMRTYAFGNRSVHDTLMRANATLCGDLRLDTFITLFYGILDVKRRTLSWARAGHEPTLLLRDNRIEVLTPSGAAVGVLSPAEFGHSLQVEETVIGPGDAILIYTDGITEAMNHHSEEFGLGRFVETVRGTAGLSSAQQIQRIEESVSAFAGDAPQQDDITLVVLTG